MGSWPSVRRLFVGTVLLLVACVLLAGYPAAAQSPGPPSPPVDQVIRAAELQRIQSESEKLRREAEKLTAETANLGSGRQLVAPLTTVAAAFLALMATIWSAKRAYTQAIDYARQAHRGAVEEKLHGRRMQIYPAALKTMSPLAIYFPHDDAAPGAPALKLNNATCAKIGGELSKWYFDEGGIYLSMAARDRYFALMTGLACASAAGELHVPNETQRLGIYQNNMTAYRKILGIDPDRFSELKIREWPFGNRERPILPASSGDEAAARAYRDYIVLQSLSSWFRTALIEDLQTRHPPAYDNG